MRSQLKQSAAHAALLLTAIIWGAAFVAQRSAMEVIGPFLFNGARFLIAALLLFGYAILVRRARLFHKDLLFSGLAMGSILFLGASLQQVGVVTTTAGKAGFITGLYVLFIPLFLRIWKGRKTALHVWMGIGSALIGLFLLSVTEELTIQSGDILVLGCAAAFAVHFLLIEDSVSRFDPFALAFWQFTLTAFASLGVASVAENFSLQSVGHVWLEILYAGVLSAGVGYTLQVVAQQHTSSVNAGIILSLESVFAAVTGWIILEEILTFRQILGSGLMFVGIIIAQLPAPIRPGFNLK